MAASADGCDASNWNAAELLTSACSAAGLPPKLASSACAWVTAALSRFALDASRSNPEALTAIAVSALAFNADANVASDDEIALNALALAASEAKKDASFLSALIAFESFASASNA